MRTNMRWMIVGIAALGLTGCAMNHEKDNDKETDEISVTMDQVPAPVKATFDSESMGNKITGIDKENHDGKFVYEADTTIGDKDYEIKVAEDGTLISKKIDDEKDEQQGEHKD